MPKEGPGGSERRIYIRVEKIDREIYTSILPPTSRYESRAYLGRGNN